jgi:hypothetical protein
VREGDPPTLSPIVLVLVLDFFDASAWWDDVAGHGNPGNPGSDGASPYQKASPLFPPIVLVLVLVLVLDFFMQVPGG